MTCMEMGKSILVGIYVAIGLYLLYKIFFCKNPNQDEYERVYNEIIHSNKYKVKGQYNKEK